MNPTLPDPDVAWQRIETHAGEVFHLLRGQAFTYEVQPGGVKPSSMNRVVRRSDFSRALEFVPLYSTSQISHLTAASYLCAILMDARIRARDW